MSRADDLLSNVQKAVGDKPFVLLAGASDLVSEKLRELPDALNAWQVDNRDLPMRAAGNLIGSVFRANLKVGELYDELTRRGQDVMTKMRGEDVVAEEDEPFVHEPFMPEPVRSVHASAPRAAASSAARKKGAAKKLTAVKTRTVVKKPTAAKRASSTKKSAAAHATTAKKPIVATAAESVTKKSSPGNAGVRKSSASKSSS